MNFRPAFFLIGLLTIGVTLVALRRQHIRTEYSVSWLAVGIILTALAGFPKLLLDRAAIELGIGGDTLFFIIAGGLISAIVFELTRVVSRLRDENVMLAQRLAILEFQMRESGSRNVETKP